ncbi:MAG: hypothetical protein HFF84_03110 [Oscillibacter sp.]|jgi:hypothetical protein|nr:hypothetical protein [Oscillibacter sp.]
MNEQDLKNCLMKCEIQYRADHTEGCSCLDWLAPYCGSVKEIQRFLRGIGFRIKEVMDEEPWPEEVHQWVITTSGVIVYVNTDSSEGLFAKAAK